jgi:hypothetical protein
MDRRIPRPKNPLLHSQRNSSRMKTLLFVQLRRSMIQRQEAQIVFLFTLPSYLYPVN